MAEPDSLQIDAIEELLKQLLRVSDDNEAPATHLSAAQLALVESLDDESLAQVVESVPKVVRLLLYNSMPAERYWPVLENLQTDTARHIFRLFTAEQLVLLREHATADLVLSFIDILPAALLQQLIGDQDEEDAEELIEALSYDEGQIGRYLDKNIMRVRPMMTVKSLRDKLRSHAEAGTHIVAVYVFDQEKNLLGYLPLTRLFLADAAQTAENLFEEITEFDHKDYSIDALRRVHAHDSALWYPVRGEKHIVGAVSLSNIVWEVQDQLSDVRVSENSSGEEDLFTPLRIAARMRGLWLIINLMTAFLASWVIGWFEVALQHVVALAILMPVVASMGGIAGSQTLAVAIRGLALNHLSDANIKLLLRKEIYISLLNGLIIGAIVALVVSYWFENWVLGCIIFVAIVINNLAAASSGTFIPFFLKKLNIDPAISGAVILTTVTDIVGFVVFLGLGSLILLSI
jgi:magnesium transporter